jgi:hypothetical protein
VSAEATPAINEVANAVEIIIFFMIYPLFIVVFDSLIKLPIFYHKDQKSNHEM